MVFDKNEDIDMTHASQIGLGRYKNLHLFMIIPFVIIQLGFIESYWMTWKEERWMHHIHAMSAMAWYALLIWQPYSATRGKLQNHRTVGMVGFFLAGATAWSAIAILPLDVQLGDQGGFAPQAPAEFFYGIILVELIMILAFCLAVIMAIIKRKQTDEHALWLICTVFFIMLPGLGRGFESLMMTDATTHTLMQPLSLAAGVILLALIAMGIFLNKLFHPAILFGVAVNIPTFFALKLGQQDWYVEWLQAVMKN